MAVIAERIPAYDISVNGVLLQNEEWSALGLNLNGQTRTLVTGDELVEWMDAWSLSYYDPGEGDRLLSGSWRLRASGQATVRVYDRESPDHPWHDLGALTIGATVLTEYEVAMTASVMTDQWLIDGNDGVGLRVVVSQGELQLDTAQGYVVIATAGETSAADIGGWATHEGVQLTRDGVIRTANFAGRSETTYQGDPVDVAESVAAALLAGARVPDIQDYQNAWPRTRFDNLAATVGMTCDWSVSGQWWFPWSSGPVPASAQLQWGTATLSAGVAPTTPTTWADLHWKDDFVRDPRYSSYDSGGLGEYTADPVAAVSWDPLKVHWQCGALEGDSTTLASGQGIVLTIGGTPPWENTPQYPDDFNSIGGRAEPFLWPDGGGSVVLNRSVDGGPTPPLVGGSVDDAILTLPGEQEVSLNLFSWQYLGTGEWSEMLHGGAIEGHWNADFSGSVSFNVASDPQTQPRVTLTTGPFRYWQPGQQSMEPPDLTGAPGPSAMRFAAGVI